MMYKCTEQKKKDMDIEDRKKCMSMDEVSLQYFLRVWCSNIALLMSEIMYNTEVRGWFLYPEQKMMGTDFLVPALIYFAKNCF